MFYLIKNVFSGSSVQSSYIASTLPKFKRSPNRRTKSRWEPIADEKLVEKLASANYDLTKSAEKVVILFVLCFLLYWKLLWVIVSCSCFKILPTASLVILFIYTNFYLFKTWTSFEYYLHIITLNFELGNVNLATF